MKKHYITPRVKTATFQASDIICTSPTVITDEEKNATEIGAIDNGTDYGNGGVGLVKGQSAWDNEW